MVMTFPRTLNGIAYLSVVSFASIIAAVFITMIGVGIIGHQAPVAVTSNLTFAKGFLAVTDIVSGSYQSYSHFVSLGVLDLRLRWACRLLYLHL